MATVSSHDLLIAHKEKHGVALASLLAAVVLTSFKLVVGIWTNSLGILSEAAHSGLDLLAAGVTLWAVRISSRPADPEHTYGHGKFENLSALIETLLLLITCVWIIYEAVDRLFFRPGVEIDANVWAFLVVILSIVIDYKRSRALLRAAKKYSSQALEADALHFSTDIWSSSVVLLGLFGVLAAEKFHISWLYHVDALAALGVAAIVIQVSWQLGRKSVEDLLDTVPRHLQEDVATAAAHVPGVKEVKLVRVRRSGPEVFTDVTLTVDQTSPFAGAHQIADAAESAVREVIPKADVMVHVEPAADPSKDDATTTVRVLAARHGLSAHGIRLYEEGGQRSLELHLEVDASLQLDEAHRQATQFERALHEAIPGLKRVVTHIEPAGDTAATVRAEPAADAEVEAVLREFLMHYDLLDEPHALNVQWANGELAISFHCRLAPDTTITEAHSFTKRLETFLRERIAHVGRVLIHVEPYKSEPRKEEGTEAQRLKGTKAEGEEG
jgi:cation diffusion facilitator family transporter